MYHLNFFIKWTKQKERYNNYRIVFKSALSQSILVACMLFDPIVTLFTICLNETLNTIT